MKLKTLLVIGFLSLISTQAIALPPPDNASSDSVKITDSINISFSNVDDTGIAIVWNGNGASTVAQCEWSSGGNHGHAQENVANYLTKGRNYIMFVLYNKVYDGGMFFAGGKWSGDMSIDKNGRTFWQNSQYKRENTRGIKYWKVIMADVSSDGTVELSEDVPSDELGMLQKVMPDLEAALNAGSGIATPF